MQSNNKRQGTRQEMWKYDNDKESVEDGGKGNRFDIRGKLSAGDNN